MQKLIAALILTILLMSCSRYSACPSFPHTPEPVKDTLRTHYDDPVFKHWISDLSRLKKKLDICK